MKKIPMRTCVACRAEKPKGELFRVVKNNLGEIFLDKTGKANGRGAYICSKECLMLAKKRKIFERQFETNLIPYEKLEEEFGKD